MSSLPPEPTPEGRAGEAPAPLATGRRALLFLAGALFLAALLFLPAGRLDWVRGWAYAALLLGGAWAHGLLLARHQPELLRRRMRVGEGTPRWDRALLPVMGVLACATVVLAGLDAVRYRWAPLPGWSFAAGLLLHVPGYALVVWAMCVNRHFEQTVRIQHELGHAVVDTGPYRLVRHPGYLGSGLFMFAIPLLLGSAWAILPALLVVAWFVARTALEDRYLLRNLSGYEAYAERVPRRLLPGLW